MPQLPTYENLGPTELGGPARPAQIPEQAASELGRVAWHVTQGFNHIASVFDGVADRAQQTENDTWLSNAKIETLKASNDLSRQLTMSAGPDGSGMENFPALYKQVVDKQAEGAPSARAAMAYKVWSADHGISVGENLATQQQARYKSYAMAGLDSDLDTLTTLTKANPLDAEKNFQVYSDKLDSLTGKAVNATEAYEKKQAARQEILKAKVLALAEQNPSDFFNAKAALDLHLKAQAGGAGATVTKRGEIPQGIPLSLSEGDRDALVRTVIGEAGGESDEGQQAVANVILNRYRLGYAPTVEGVVKQKGQFEAWSSRGAELAAIDKNSPDYKRVAANIDPLLAGAKPDNTGGATHFYSPSLQAALERKPPSWASYLKPTGTIGGHAFFTDTSRMKSPSMAIASGIDLSKLPTLGGSSLQPADIASLAPKDYDAMDRTLRPYVTVNLEAKMKDAVANLLTSGTQNSITKDDLTLMRSVLGPKIAQKMQGQLDDAQQTWAVNQTVQNMTPTQQAEWLQQLKPSAAEGDTNAAEWNLYRRAAKSITDFQTQLKKDPFGFIARNTDLGQEALKVFQSAPQGADGTALREHALDMIAQAQREHGLPDAGVQVMPKQVVDDTVSRLANAKSGEEATGILNDLRTTYGKYFNQLWRDAVRAGAPEGLQVASLATNKGQNELVDAYRMEKEYADAAGKGANRKTILAQKAGVTEKDIRQEVSSQTADFIAGLHDPANSSAVQEAVEKVALRQMLVNGKSQGDAVRYAVQELYGNRYAVYDKVIVPRTLYDSSDGGSLRLGVYHADSLIDQFRDQIDPRQRMSDPLRNKEDAKEDYMGDLLSHYRLVTTEQGPGGQPPRGVYVLDQFGRRVMLKGEGGTSSPLVLPWERFIGHGNALRGYTTKLWGE